MPYTNPVEIPTLKTEIDKFKAIADEAAISPVVLGNLLYQLASHINKAAAAFGVPPNIPYAETFKLEVLENAVKLKFTYRQPDGYDQFPELTIPLVSEANGLAGLMSPDDKRMLGIVANLAQSMQDGNDIGFNWAEYLRDWFNEAYDSHMELIYQINAKPTAGSVPIEVATLDIMNPGNGEYDREIRTTIEAATTETAGVMTAADKDILNTLAKEFKTLRFQMDHVLEVFENNGW